MYKKKQWRKLLAVLLSGWWQHQRRIEMSCHTYRLTTKVSSPQKVDLNQPLPDDWCHLISQNHIMPALFDHDFGGNREREGVLGACPFEVLHIISFSLDYWSIYWHLCSTIALSHVIFWSGWTSEAHLMYPVLSYQVVSQDHVHLLMNMTALMMGILRVEERGNELTSQAIAIDSRSKIQKLFFQTGSRHTQVQGTVRQQAKMCFPAWVLKKQPALWMASWNVKAIVASQVCHIEQA